MEKVEKEVYTNKELRDTLESYNLNDDTIDLIKINLASGNDSNKKENNNNIENDSIVGISNDYLAKFNEIKNNNNKDSFVNTSNGLFNKHNLPPSSRPNVIDIFDATEPFVESEIVQHSFEGDGNIFLPKVYVY